MRSVNPARQRLLIEELCVKLCYGLFAPDLIDLDDRCDTNTVKESSADENEEKGSKEFFLPHVVKTKVNTNTAS